MLRQTEALIHSEELFRNIFENASIGMAIGVPDGTFSRTNAAFDRMMGYEPGDLIGVHRSAVTPPEDVGENEQRYRRFLETGQPSLAYEKRYIRKDGRIIWVDMNVSFVRDADGHAKFSIIMARDVTEHKRAEEERRRLASAVEEAVDGIAIVGPDTTVLYVNPAWCGITGYAREEVIGNSIDVIGGAFSQDAGVSIDRTLSGESVWSGRVKRLRKDGTPYDAELRISPLKNAEGRVAGTIELTRDISEELNMEDQLRQAQKMEAIGTLAAGIAHDFNNILSAIMGFTGMAIDHLSKASKEYNHLHRVLQSAHRGRDLVKQILAFSRKAGHIREPISVTPIINETSQLLRAGLPATIEIVLDMRANGDTIHASLVEVQQVLMNLATNAARAMREKGGVLHIGLTNTDLESGSPIMDPDMEPGEYIQLVVKDTGVGMSPDVMKRIFDPFFTTSAEGEGTGVGLTVVYGIVKSLDGAITVESEPGMGSAFRVFFPKVRTDAQSGVLLADKSHCGTERILFVDDENMLVELGRDLLEMLGYTVTAFTDSTEALDLFSSDPSRFDLVITDETMPKLTGLHLARSLLKIRNDIPIILCTGHNNDISPEIAKDAGVREFIMKPFTNEELAEVIRRVLDKSRV